MRPAVMQGTVARILPTRGREKGVVVAEFGSWCLGMDGTNEACVLPLCRARLRVFCRQEEGKKALSLLSLVLGVLVWTVRMRHASCRYAGHGCAYSADKRKG